MPPHPDLERELRCLQCRQRNVVCSKVNDLDANCSRCIRNHLTCQDSRYKNRHTTFKSIINTIVPPRLVVEFETLFDANWALHPGLFFITQAFAALYNDDDANDFTANINNKNLMNNALHYITRWRVNAGSVIAFYLTFSITGPFLLQRARRDEQEPVMKLLTDMHALLDRMWAQIIPFDNTIYGNTRANRLMEGRISETPGYKYVKDFAYHHGPLDNFDKLIDKVIPGDLQTLASERAPNHALRRANTEQVKRECHLAIKTIYEYLASMTNCKLSDAANADPRGHNNIDRQIFRWLGGFSHSEIFAQKLGFKLENGGGVDTVPLWEAMVCHWLVLCYERRSVWYFKGILEKAVREFRDKLEDLTDPSSIRKKMIENSTYRYAMLIPAHKAGINTWREG